MKTKREIGYGQFRRRPRSISVKISPLIISAVAFLLELVNCLLHGKLIFKSGWLRSVEIGCCYVSVWWRYEVKI